MAAIEKITSFELTNGLQTIRERNINNTKAFHETKFVKISILPDSLC